MSNVPPPPAPPAPPAAESSELTPEQRRLLIGVGAGALLLVAAVVVSVIWMVQPQNAGATATIRDIFIIFLALESLFIGLALMVLMIQIAKLTNLLQHEIKPILQNTNETVNTVRSTAIFVSENLVDPVMKLNSYVAAIGKLFDLINIVGKQSKK
jgi:hypothetical protein